MNARTESEVVPMQHSTNVERKSDRELVVTRTFNGPARLVFKAWTTAELFKQWWVPKSFPITLLSCEMDARTGGGYKLTFANGDAPPMEFFGKYLEVVPNSRVVWTNEEGGEGGPVTTVTFEEQGGTTLVVLRDLYPSKQALDEAMVSGSTGGFSESFDQLETLLGSLGANAGR
ncbi:MAG: SRPBCC family protein [Gemmatimonadales bacterium]